MHYNQTDNFINMLYEIIYKEYHFETDERLISNWRYHQLHMKEKNDYDWIAFTVCEDLLRQRGNTYLDDIYPKD